jgi:hypothetical protein
MIKKELMTLRVDTNMLVHSVKGLVKSQRESADRAEQFSPLHGSELSNIWSVVSALEARISEQEQALATMDQAVWAEVSSIKLVRHHKLQIVPSLLIQEGRCRMVHALLVLEHTDPLKPLLLPMALR